MATEYGKDQAPVEQQAVLVQEAMVKPLPSNVQENPSLAVGEDMAYRIAVDQQVQSIMAFFLAVLPSNYTSQTKGPFYTMQFQAAAEQIARIQVSASEIFTDADADFTRPEFLYQILGSLVFPDVDTDGVPTLPSDLAQRKFIKDMIGILLQGATKSALYEAIKLLTSADVQIIEKAITARSIPNTAYTLADQFQFEITLAKAIRTSVTSVSGSPSIAPHSHTLSVDETGNGKTVDTVWTTSTEGEAHTHDIYDWLLQPYVATTTIPAHYHDIISDFPDADPLSLLRNVLLVLKAIKPAHTLYDYRNLFRETFRTLFSDSASFVYNTAYYDDLRKYWWGAARLTGLLGETLADRTLFSDPTRSFARISVGAALTVLSGPNAIDASNTDQNTVGRYTVTDILTFPVPSDTSVVLFTTIPTGLNGHLQITGTNTLQAMVFDVATNQYIPDTAFNWAGIEENEILFITEGANEGNYRFDVLLGNNGGPVLTAIGPAYQARMAPSLLRLDRRMRYTTSSQQYEVVVDRLGVLTPQQVVNEDVSGYFITVPPPLPPVTPAVNPDFLFGSLTEPVPGDIYRSAFLTQNGPLVKDWGDMTMATKNDVTVLVNGVPVAVDSVNPYTGRIDLVTPIQITPAPMMPWVVEVSYNWMPKAITDIIALNTVGLVLNQWDRSINRDATTALADQQLGAVSNGSRFQLGIELGPIADQEPLYVGWRYLGLERAYTAALNDPTSLLLNQNPHALQTDTFEVTPSEVAVSYEGTGFPIVENWALVGTDSGTLVGNGTYEVKANNVGPYGVGQPALYYQMTDMTLPATGRVVTRLTLDPATVTPTGVFTGVVFGTHDNRRSYIVGLLLLPALATEAPFRCIGFLLDPARPDLRASWLAGFQTDSSVATPKVTITAQNKLSVITSTMPQNVKAGTRFRIESGPQQGVYTVSSAVAQTGREKQVWGNTLTFTGQVQQNVTFPVPLVTSDYRVEFYFDPEGPGGYATNKTASGFTLVLTGTAGYTGSVVYKVYQTLATTTITTTTNFPADFSLFGGKYPTLLWELDYSVATTYALTVSTSTHAASVYCSGALFGTFLTATATTPLAQPAQVGPLDYGYAGG